MAWFLPQTIEMRLLKWGSIAAALGLAGFGGWILTLPPAQAAAEPAPIDAREAAAAIDALKPPKRARPVVAVIGINDATETTDYLMPAGILRRADVADVTMVATGPGPVRLYPALTVEPDATTAEFDASHPDGADYVIVPAMSRDDDPAALDWIRRQAEKGAIVIGVCAGAKVVGAAGLLDGRRATTHWFYVRELRRDNPEVVYVPDRRIVVDRTVATTTGITASMPLALTLVEAIAGRASADAVAREVGLPGWDARHDSSAFTLTRPFALTVLGNTMRFWNREELGIELAPGVDEVSLALVADAWSRTYRSRAVTFARDGRAVESRNGMRIVADTAASDWPGGRVVTIRSMQKPAEALDGALAAIAERYGARTRAVVAMQLEYPPRRPDGLQH